MNKSYARLKLEYGLKIEDGRDLSCSNVTLFTHFVFCTLDHHFQRIQTRLFASYLVLGSTFRNIFMIPSWVHLCFIAQLVVQKLQNQFGVYNFGFFMDNLVPQKYYLEEPMGATPK